MINPVLPLTLHVEGPFISQDKGAPVFGIDTPTLKDGEQVVLPGTQIKGLLREVFKAAGGTGATGLDREWLNCWFGDESGAIDSDASDSYGPKPGRMFVADFSAKPPKHPKETITRISVDDERGSVEEGMLQVVETPWGYGEVAIFTGEVRLWGNVSKAELKTLKARLDWAFQLIPAVGAFKTAGFGRLLCAKIDEWKALDLLQEVQEVDETDLSVGTICDDGGADFKLHPGEPFLVWPRSFGGNFFAGDAVIPGQVLKAVAARWLKDRGLLKGYEDALANLIFRHARPVPDNRPCPPNPAEIPLSIYLALDESGAVAKYGDSLDSLRDDFCEWSQLATIAFQPDWKGIPCSLAKHYGHCELPGRVTRTRTAVGKDGVAEDERLFTHAAVDPKGFVWRTQHTDSACSRRLSQEEDG